MSAPFTYRLRVRYAECDMQGHVFNSHYLTYFDVAHTELVREAIGSYSAFIEAGVDLVVAEARVRYRSPARFDDELEVGVALAPPTNTSLTSRFTVRRGEDVVAEGELRHVCVDAKGFTKKPWPAEIRETLEPYVVTDGAAA